MSLNFRLFDIVDKTISPEDSMYHGNRDHYFSVGNSAINCIQSAMKSTGKDHSAIRQILDLPCGHGRITRWLAATFPEAEITACDLDKSGVDFCKNHFNAYPVYSDVNPEKINIQKKFDLIWCGSLFTHLDFKYWKKFLNLFDSLLAIDGILVFTTHGQYVVFRGQNGFDYGLKSEIFNKIADDFYHSGFGYENYQPSGNYGISVVKPSRIFDMLESFSDLRVVLFEEKGWDHHQDIIACFKDSHFKELYFDYTEEFKQLTINATK